MQYERKIQKVGNSLCIIIPSDLAEYMKLELGSEVVIQDDKSKYGNFISFWKKDQKKEV